MTVTETLAKSRAILDRIDGMLKCRHGVPSHKPYDCPQCVARAQEFDCGFVTWKRVKPPNVKEIFVARAGQK